MRSLRNVCSKLRHPASSSILSLAACLLQINLYCHQIYAANGDPITHAGGGHSSVHDVPKILRPRENVASYEPDFVGFDRGIIGRAEEDINALTNNVPGQLNIEQGDDQYWTFTKQSLFSSLAPPASGFPSPLGDQPLPPQYPPPNERVLYISFNTCIQPTPKTSTQKLAPAQLEVYISTTSENTHPSATSNDHVIIVDGGFGWSNISVESDVYIGVSAPINNDFGSSYNYQLTASIDGFYAEYFGDNTNAFFIDSDNGSALLYTSNVTTGNTSAPPFQQWMRRQPPFSIFVVNQDNPSLLGMQSSLCALQNFADVQAPAVIDTNMTSAGDGQPKQQFHVRTLNASSSYIAFVAMIGNSTKSGNGIVGGGGIVWNSTSFKTKSGMLLSPSLNILADAALSEANCALLYNLPFCTSVAYSAPARLNETLNVTRLGQLYDDYAHRSYVNFSKSLQQIPCDTTSSAKYSLTRTCLDCDQAYKNWLCAVTIPRCEDFSNPAQYLQPRAVNQTFANQTLADDPAFNFKNESRVAFADSRNPWIDSTIRPDPYKEVLPCQDLCYELVRSCPASLQFACPLENHGLNFTYGTRAGYSNNTITCSSPQAGIDMQSGSARLGITTVYIVFGIALVIMMI